MTQWQDKAICTRCGRTIPAAVDHARDCFVILASAGFFSLFPLAFNLNGYFVAIFAIVGVLFGARIAMSCEEEAAERIAQNLPPSPSQ